MTNTALRAENSNSRTITFKSKEHEKFNLYCNGAPSVGDYEAEEDQLKECQYYSIEDLFCCGYARYFWEAIKIRYPEYCFYKDWEDMYAED